jgi:hypothetical protein
MFVFMFALVALFMFVTIFAMSPYRGATLITAVVVLVIGVFSAATFHLSLSFCFCSSVRFVLLEHSHKSDENDRCTCSRPGVSKIVERVESTNTFMHASHARIKQRNSEASYKRSIMTPQQTL